MIRFIHTPFVRSGRDECPQAEDGSGRAVRDPGSHEHHINRDNDDAATSEVVPERRLSGAIIALATRGRDATAGTAQARVNTRRSIMVWSSLWPLTPI